MSTLGIWIAKRIPWRLWNTITVNGQRYVGEEIAIAILAERDRIYQKYKREKARRIAAQEKNRVVNEIDDEDELMDRELVKSAQRLQGSAAKALEVIERLKAEEEKRRPRWWQFWKV